MSIAAFWPTYIAGVSDQKVEPKAGLAYSSISRSLAQYMLAVSRSCHSWEPGAGSPAGARQSGALVGTTAATWARASCSACARCRTAASAAVVTDSSATAARAGMRGMPSERPSAEELAAMRNPRPQVKRVTGVDVHSECGDRDEVVGGHGCCGGGD